MTHLRIIILSVLLQIWFACGTGGSNTKFTNSIDQSDSGQYSVKAEEKNDTLIILEKHKKEIINFFKIKNVNQINQCIDKDMKLTILFSIGVNPQYVKLDSISENYEYYLDQNIPFWVAEEILPNLKDVQLDNLIITNDPIFECERILQQGSFIDKGEHTKIMTNSIERLIHVAEIEEQNQYLMTLKKDYIFYSNIEPQSIRIVTTHESYTHNKFVISAYHFTEKNGKLYLTLMDFESFNCSI